MLGVDWRALFLPQVPLLELFLRGSIIYLGLFLLMRLVLKREIGAVSMTDILVIVLLADVAQNAMAGGSQSISDGLILILIIIGWSHLLNWLGYRYAWAGRLVYPKPLVLVENGHIQWENMRRELITEEELMSQLREMGIDDVSDVKAAYMEGHGRVSVIPIEKRKQTTGANDDEARF